MMARDFQQQLESEINIEEINRTARKTVEDALSTTPARTEPVPEPAAADPPMDEDAKKLAESGYPYGVVEPEPQPAPASDAEPQPVPVPHDDTYSHAHGHDPEPMADPSENSLEPPPAPLADAGAFKKDDAAA
jgi:hypothetical protein